MPQPERVEQRTDYCAAAVRWGVDPDTMRRVVIAAQQYTLETALPVDIISGARTAREQRDLGERGRPTAPDAVSTHRSCPATGVDISLGFLPVLAQKQIWGRLVILAGLRWGGGSALDDHFIPSDWQHVDQGPRA